VVKTNVYGVCESVYHRAYATELLKEDVVLKNESLVRSRGTEVKRVNKDASFEEKS
jgi:hypothetical protein